MMRTLTAVACLLSILWAAAQAEPGGYDLRPAFTASCVAFHDSAGLPVAEVALEVIPGELSFVKADAGFRAEVDIAISLFDEHDELRGGDVWRRVVDLPRYRDLSRAEPVLRERRQFRVPGGRYRVRVEVRDLNADMARAREMQLEVAGGGGRQGSPDLRLSGLQLGPLVDSTGAPRRSSIRPSLVLSFGDPLPRLACFGEAYLSGPGPDTLEVRAELFDEGGRSLEHLGVSPAVRAGTASFLLRPAFERLGTGAYDLRVEARWGREKARAEIRFEMDETRVMFDGNFDQVLEMLSLVSRGAELDSLRDCPPAERRARWDRFWARHNPDPEARGNAAEREFFRRIRYANQHYATSGSGPGWRTDMGRVYIRYGLPEQTERRPRTSTDPITEIWYYSEPTRMTFIFVDRSGFGRFDLVDQRGVN
jgi:GWxTD domain-containing protein